MSDVVELSSVPPERVEELDCAAATALGGQICAAAGLAAEADCQLLELIAAFDAGNAVRWFTGVKSSAHWLAWSCSMSPGTAREHVRVARALPKMPTATALFRQGRLSFSKVREISRVVDTVDEAELCTLALQATAAQLAKTVSGYRTAAGTRLRQERERRLTWTERESGVVDLRLRLPKEEAATFLAALQASKDQFGAPPPRPEESRHDRTRNDDGGGGSVGGEDDCVGPGVEAETAADSRDDSAANGRVGNGGSAGKGVGATDATPVYTLADAALDMARVFLATAPEDRSGEDRSLVVVHVNADTLAGRPGDVSARAFPPESPGTPAAPTGEEPEPGDSAGTAQPPTEVADVDADQEETQTDPVGSGLEQTDLAGPSPTDAAADSSDVPAGTPQATSSTCHIQGLGGIEADTARKLACDADLLGAIIDAHGDVLALGRTRRLVSRAQRRALMIRDRGLCQFSGCHQTHHLKAHHLIHWFDGGPTDLDNLILLCQFHHTAVHEGRMIIRRTPQRQWEFLMPDGTPHKDWWSAEGLLAFLHQHADRDTDPNQAAQRHQARAAALAEVTGFSHSDARRIQPGWSGERYDRHEAVQALFRMPVRPAQRADDLTDQAA